MPKNLNIAISFDEKNSSGTLEFNIETNKPLGNIKYFNMRGRLASKKDLFGKRPIRLVDVESDVPNFGRNGQADMAVILGLENYKTLSGVEFAKRDAYWIRRYFQRVLRYLQKIFSTKLILKWIRTPLMKFLGIKGG